MNTHHHVQRVVLIDDSENDNFFPQRALRKAGFGGEIVIFESGERALDFLLQDQVSVPTVVFLDINMPGMNGVSGLRRAIRSNGTKPVAIITGNPTPRMLDEIMNAGSSGILLKTTGVRSLANAIRFMNAGEHYMPLELVRERHNAGRTTKNGRLSDKEMMVLSYLAEGKQNKEIANDLKLAEPTIKMHVTSICKKLSATNRTQAVIVARDLGLI